MVFGSRLAAARTGPVLEGFRSRAQRACPWHPPRRKASRVVHPGPLGFWNPIRVEGVSRGPQRSRRVNLPSEPVRRDGSGAKPFSGYWGWEVEFKDRSETPTSTIRYWVPRTLFRSRSYSFHAGSHSWAKSQCRWSPCHWRRGAILIIIWIVAALRSDLHTTLRLERQSASKAVLAVPDGFLSSDLTLYSAKG
jgi:hypothetical protein